MQALLHPMVEHLSSPSPPHAPSRSPHRTYHREAPKPQPSSPISLAIGTSAPPPASLSSTPPSTPSGPVSVCRPGTSHPTGGCAFPLCAAGKSPAVSRALRHTTSPRPRL